eukprot:COSAG01_NODE_43386_length_430_cov_0.960725_2_plen_36_part_01
MPCCDVRLFQQTADFAKVDLRLVFFPQIGQLMLAAS